MDFNSLCEESRLLRSEIEEAALTSYGLCMAPKIFGRLARLLEALSTCSSSTSQELDPSPGSWTRNSKIPALLQSNILESVRAPSTPTEMERLVTQLRLQKEWHADAVAKISKWRRLSGVGARVSRTDILTAWNDLDAHLWRHPDQPRANAVPLNPDGTKKE